MGWGEGGTREWLSRGPRGVSLGGLDSRTGSARFPTLRQAQLPPPSMKRAPATEHRALRLARSK